MSLQAERHALRQIYDLANLFWVACGSHIKPTNYEVLYYETARSAVAVSPTHARYNE